MTTVPTNPPRPLPLWLKVAGSVFAVGHLLAIGLYALAASSGPWATPYGVNSPVDGPQFAAGVSSRITGPYYLQPLRLASNYHFASNRPAEYAVYFEIQLRNQFGESTIIRIPEEKANYWVRHRQEILAQHLAQDFPVPQRGARKLPALEPTSETPTVDVWLREGEFTLRFESLDEDDKRLLSRDLLQPSPKAKLLAESYTRYLARAHKAASARLIRHSRPKVTPTDVVVPRPEVFTDLVSHFGEYRRDK